MLDEAGIFVLSSASVDQRLFRGVLTSSTNGPRKRKESRQIIPFTVESIPPLDVGVRVREKEGRSCGASFLCNPPPSLPSKSGFCGVCIPFPLPCSLPRSHLLHPSHMWELSRPKSQIIGAHLSFQEDGFYPLYWRVVI